MSVRVNKSAFNIRERLSELERPIGVKGNELMRAETAQDARDFISAGRKNLIINGAMMVAQRGTSQASVSSLGYYTVDRFQTMLSNLGTWTVSRETDAPNGFQYSLKHTCTTADSSPASSDYAIIYQRFETQNVKNSLRYGTSSAQNVTLSFWVKSNKTGNASTGIFFSNSGTNRYISKQYQINNSGTWEYKTITFPPNTTLTMDLGDTEAGLFVEWWMNSGSNFSGGNHDIWSTSSTVRNASNLGVGGATSDYFQITGVQLEVGKNATEFEHRSYGEELALCQRYYQRIGKVSSDGNTSRTIMLGAYNVTRAFGGLPISVAMRTRTPTITYSNLYLESLNLVSFLAITSFTRYGAMGIDGSFLGVEANVASGLSSGSPYYISFQGGQNGFLALDTEL